MVGERARERLLTILSEKGIESAPVLAAMANVPRHLFVDEALAHRAYDDVVLPIGYEQTISQPFIVARMTEVLYREAKHDRILEIGTGCGYQAAVLAQLWTRVYSIERIRDLHRYARQRLLALGLANIQTKAADGHYGWPEEAPFDAIMLTAAPPEIPQRLLAQLGEGGCLLAPVGAQGAVQYLTLVRRIGDDFEYTQLDAVRFVPMRKGIED